MGLAVITGASSGIGREFARQLHLQGMRLLLVARRKERLDELCTQLNKARPDTAEALVCDLSDMKSLASLETRLKTETIELLVNNAGFGSYGAFETLPVEKEQEMILTNVLATMRLCHAVIPQMKARRSGGIISLASVAGFLPMPFMATYGATKAFNHQHSLALREELAPFGVNVLTVCPGPIATEFRQVSGYQGSSSDIVAIDVEQCVRESLQAFDRKAARVVTGNLNALLSIILRLFPRLMCKILAGMTRPRNADKQLG